MAVASMVKAGVPALMAAHEEDWGKFWEKSAIQLPDSRLENLYYAELYKHYCSSRPGHLPVTLQGLWTTDGSWPPWRGTYTADMNVEEWANYWAAAKVDAVLVSVTGILAFYQSKVPYHKPGKFLGNRDFFGECCTAAKKRGIRVVARMSPDLQWQEALDAHPEWFERDAEGQPRRHNEDLRLFRTCMFGAYFTDFMPAIMREVNSLYDVDGLYTNAWPPLGTQPVCHCENCRRLAKAGTPDYWDQFNQRILYLWKLYDGIAKEKRPENLFYANLGGGVRGTPNLKLLGSVCDWFNCDNQGRGGDDTPIWGCAQQGRVCAAVMKGRTSTNVTGG